MSRLSHRLLLRVTAAALLRARRERAMADRWQATQRKTAEAFEMRGVTLSMARNLITMMQRRIAALEAAAPSSPPGG